MDFIKVDLEEYDLSYEIQFVSLMIVLLEPYIRFDRKSEAAEIYRKGGGTRLLIEEGISKHMLIKMNNPLRLAGYTFYQSSFIESSEGETSVLAAVKNYGRLFPYISSIIMCLGLLIHLTMKLPDLFKKRKV